jgi:hypothetical protein
MIYMQSIFTTIYKIIKPSAVAYKSGRLTGHHDRCIIKFADQDGCFVGHF